MIVLHGLILSLHLYLDQIIQFRPLFFFIFLCFFMIFCYNNITERNNSSANDYGRFHFFQYLYLLIVSFKSLTSSLQYHEKLWSYINQVGKSDPSFPIQKKRVSREFLRTKAHLRARTNTFGAVCFSFL